MYVDRDGNEICFDRWAALFNDWDYRVVAHDIVVPTIYEVLTVWEGISGAGFHAFSTGVGGVGPPWQADWRTVAQLDTEDAARDAHAVQVAYLRLAVSRATVLAPSPNDSAR